MQAIFPYRHINAKDNKHLVIDAFCIPFQSMEHKGDLQPCVYKVPSKLTTFLVVRVYTVHWFSSLLPLLPSLACWQMAAPSSMVLEQCN